MWAWQKKRSEDRPARGIARAALEGASQDELLREAIHALRAINRADRIGVWLEHDTSETAGTAGVEEFRGMVWDSGGDDTPDEWRRLSLELPLPKDLLVSGKAVEQELSSAANRPVFGLLIGLHHALWTPVHVAGRVRGVLLVGSQHRPATPRPERSESVAADLALALEFREERLLAQLRQADLRLQRQVLAGIASGASADSILADVSTSCTESAGQGLPPIASFAVIGHLPRESATAPVPEMEFSWDSGDPEWTRAVERDPLATVWRQALAAGHVVGVEPPASAHVSGLARLVAIPLSVAGNPLGVFVAGIPPRASSLQNLERLELRAALAAVALERRRLHTQSTRSAARRRAHFDLSPEPAILLDARGTVSGVNRSARDLLEERHLAPASGAVPEAMLAHKEAGEPWYSRAPFAQLFSAREHERLLEWLRHSLSLERDKEEASPASFEAELINGVRVRLHAPLPAEDEHSAVLLDPLAGEESPILRTRAETELYNVLEWVEEGILLFSANQTIRAMNTRFAQIVGFSAEEAAACSTLENLVGQLSSRAAEPEAFAQRWRELARGSDGGIREEVPLARPVPRVLERSVRPVLDSLGRRLGRIEIYRDLTAQRVFQAKLLQTEKLAGLGQMITGIAHELSNPLTSILGYSQRLLVRRDAAGRAPEARQIFQEAERASAILRQLLMSARETRPERKRISLNRVVERAMELQRFSSAAEKIRIEVDLDPALPLVMGDAGQLQQVLMNLIGNARQALMQDGKPGAIRLRTAHEGRRVRLQVTDDGPGIPQSILARIFDPFFTTKPAGVGTGLGLAIVLSVIREHGGQVHVSSSPGAGATFIVELPAAAESSSEVGAHPGGSRENPLPTVPAPSLATFEPLPEKRVARHAVHRGAHVLVLEDEPTVARLVADVLEDEGMRVDVLFDGREALGRAARKEYDLVICDMKMPGMDGQRFYQTLAEARDPLGERFLFITGDVLAAHTRQFLESHRLPYVAKPFRVEELTEKVFSLLDGNAARTGRAAAVRKAR
jgi:signal transduction histidine kinase/CheY-like chemotaxis protein